MSSTASHARRVLDDLRIGSGEDLTTVRPNGARKVRIATRDKILDQSTRTRVEPKCCRATHKGRIINEFHKMVGELDPTTSKCVQGFDHMRCPKFQELWEKVGSGLMGPIHMGPLVAGARKKELREKLQSLLHDRHIVTAWRKITHVNETETVAIAEIMMDSETIKHVVAPSDGYAEYFVFRGGQYNAIEAWIGRSARHGYGEIHPETGEKECLRHIPGKKSKDSVKCTCHFSAVLGCKVAAEFIAEQALERIPGLTPETYRHVRFQIDSDSTILFHAAELANRMGDTILMLQKVAGKDVTLSTEAIEVVKKVKLRLRRLLCNGSPDMREIFATMCGLLHELVRDVTSLTIESRKTGKAKLSLHDLDREHISVGGWKLESVEWVYQSPNEMDLYIQTGIAPHKKFSELTEDEECKFAMYLNSIGWKPSTGDNDDDKDSFYSAESERNSGSLVSTPGAASSASNDFIPAMEEEKPALYQEGQCVACQDAEATFVVSTCGHLAYCLKCRRGAVFRQLKASSAARGLPEKRQLQSRHLERTAVGCPICRKEGRLVLMQKYEGKVFLS